MSTALLLIDELDFDPVSRQEASLSFRLVSYRYGRGAIMITTDKSVRDWTELLPGDEVLTTAILDRPRTFSTSRAAAIACAPRGGAEAGALVGRLVPTQIEPLRTSPSWHRGRCRPWRCAPAPPVPLHRTMERTCARRPPRSRSGRGNGPHRSNKGMLAFEQHRD